MDSRPGGEIVGGKPGLLGLLEPLDWGEIQGYIQIQDQHSSGVWTTRTLRGKRRGSEEVEEDSRDDGTHGGSHLHPLSPLGGCCAQYFTE